MITTAIFFRVFLCFSVNFAKFLRTNLLQNISGRLLLKIMNGNINSNNNDDNNINNNDNDDKRI